MIPTPGRNTCQNNCKVIMYFQGLCEFMGVDLEDIKRWWDIEYKVILGENSLSCGYLTVT